MLRTTARRCRRAGFTLIELLIVIMIIGILATFLLPRIPEAIEQANITASRKNLSEIYRGVNSYKLKYDRFPRESGVKFFACLIYDRVWENTPSAAKKLTCPGVDISALTIADYPPEEWFIDEDVIDGSYSAYAGRNVEEFPLRKLSGKDAWVATDNDVEMNFSTTTLVLMGDGSVEQHEIVTLQDQGILDEDEDYLFVGEDSQLEALRKLTLD